MTHTIYPVAADDLTALHETGEVEAFPYLLLRNTDTGPATIHGAYPTVTQAGAALVRETLRPFVDGGKPHPAGYCLAHIDDCRPA